MRSAVPDYRVKWEIDAEDVSSPRSAAWFARDAQTRENTTATVFTVTDRKTGESVQVDLGDEEELG